MNRHEPAARVGWSAHDGPSAFEPAEPLTRGLDDDPLTGVSALLDALRNGARGLLVWVACCVALAGVYLLRTPPEFVATTQIVLEPRRPVVGEADANAIAVPALDSAQADSQMQVLKSERTLRFVFDTLNLADDPTYAAQGPGLIVRLVSHLAGSSATPLSPEDQASLASAQAFQSFSDRASVRRLGQSYVLELSFRAPTAHQAARLANSITAAYIRDQVEFRAATATRGTEFLQGRISDIKAEKQIAVEAVRTGVIPDYQFADSDARVVSAALDPLGKAYPQSSLILLLAVSFGLLSGGVGIAIRHKLDRTIRSRQQVSRLLGVDGVHALPRLQDTGRAGQGEWAFTSVLNEADSPFADALRVLRTAVLSASRGSRRMAIGVVSWSPGEGRSTVAGNLAFLVAASRERVVLIDADFRDPALSRTLAPDAAVGLDEALLSHAARALPLAVVLSRSLSVVPAVAKGRVGNPNVFIGSSEMQLFLQALHQEQDIIIDLPPMSLSSDVQAVGHLLDGVILLAEADRTTLEDLNEAYRTLRAANTRVLGVVLNKVTIRAGRTRRLPRFRFRPAWSIRR